MRVKQAAALEHCHTLALKSLLNDVATSIGSVLQLAAMPRAQYYQEQIFEDLFKRIHDQEFRASKPAIVTLLYTARGALQIVARTLKFNPEHQPLTAGELTIIRENYQRIERALAEAEVLTSDSVYAVGLANAHTFVGRLMAWLISKTSAGRRLTARLVERHERKEAVRIERGW